MVLWTAEVSMFGLGVLTISTSGYQGQRKEDTSGQAIKEMLGPPDYQLVRYEIVSDDKDMIADRMTNWADAGEVDLIVSTGGTGLGVRDFTPEVCLSIIDKEVPGLAEAMRARTLQFTPMAMLSRSVAGIRGKTLIITLPGSPKAVRECLDVVKPVLRHALELLKDEAGPQHPV
jgi:molybdenum cofactor synthesis domain-containing protein